MGKRCGGRKRSDKEDVPVGVGVVEEVSARNKRHESYFIPLRHPTCYLAFCWVLMDRGSSKEVAGMMIQAVLRLQLLLEREPSKGTLALESWNINSKVVSSSI